MVTLDLRQGISDNKDYKAFKFHGGEVHFVLKHPEVLYTSNHVKIIAKVNNSDEFMLLLHAIDTVKKDKEEMFVEVFLPYMPYQQADRDFSVGESFSLKTVTNILNMMPVDKYVIFDPHSDVTPALLKKSKVIDNSDFISEVVHQITFHKGETDSNNLVMLSPDAGAYKKIGKLATKINFQGEVASANKSRNISTGNIESLELSKQDFEGKDVLIVDDICVGGRTFVELAKKLKERNVGNLYLAVSHGVFSHGFKELNSHFSGIYATDSRLDYFNDPEFSMRYDGEMEKLVIVKL